MKSLKTLALSILVATGASRLTWADIINVVDQQDILLIQDLGSKNTLAYVQGTTKLYGYGLGGEGFTGHSVVSLLQFDLSSLNLSASQVASAQINLYSVSASAAGLSGSEEDPTATNPVTIDATALGASWNQNTVSYTGGTLSTPDAFGNTVTYAIPSTVGSVAGQFQVTGTNQWVTIDITNLVQGWLSGATANNGVLLTSDQWYRDASNGNKTVGATFDSLRASSNAPFLSIQTVPEPSSIVLGVTGFTLALGLRFLRRRWTRSGRRATQLAD
jgi:hypothetical protein